MSDPIPGQAPLEEIEIRVIETPLSQVQRIGKSRSIHIENADDLKEIVEAPLLRACQILYEKQIQTYESSANSEHVRLNYPMAAHLSFNGDQLTPQNRNILQNIIASNPSGYTISVSDPQSYEPKFKSMVSFEIPMEDNITQEEIERRSVEFANHFVPNVTVRVLDDDDLQVMVLDDGDPQVRVLE